MAAALVVVECGVRLISRVHPSVAIRHPVLGKTHQPGFEGAVFIEEAGRDVFLRFNSTGFRGEDHPLAKAQGEIRIAMLGDSMVAAVEVDEREQVIEVDIAGVDYIGAAKVDNCITVGVRQRWVIDICLVAIHVKRHGIGKRQRGQATVTAGFARVFEKSCADVVMCDDNGTGLGK